MFRRTAPIAVFILLSMSRNASAEGTRVVHAPPGPAAAGEPVVLTFTVLGEEGAASADVYARSENEETFERFPAEERRGVYRATIPPRVVAAPGFEYFVLVVASGGEEVTSPARDPRGSPHRVRVKSGAMSERIVVLSPAPDEVIASAEEALVSALFDPPLLPGDSAVLYLDGRDVTAASEITPDYLLFRPAASLTPGAHEASVVLLEATGGASERRWSFFLAGGREHGLPIDMSGKIEAGWALVSNAGIQGEPFLPYETTSSALFDLYAYGDWSGRSIYLSASRDPIYDSEIRAAARLSGEHLTLEAGDIYPSFSELAVSWLSGEGGLVSAHAAGFENTAFLVRTLPSDTTGGFGTYSQFAAGERLAYARDRWSAAVNASYGWERESSIPDSLRFLLPVSNLVITSGGSARVAGDVRLHVEAGWSDTKGDDSTSAAAWRALLTLLDGPKRRLSVEFHDYRPGYYAASSPTVDGGERGALVDGTVRIASRLRQTIKVEVYEDRESSQEIEEGGKIVQVYGRTDVDWSSLGADWNAYLLFRTYRIPYVADAYRSRYGTAGLYARRGSTTLSLNGTASRSRSSSRTDSWAASAYVSGAARGGAVTWKIGERYSASETREDTTDTGVDVTVSDPTRWTFEVEAGITRAGLEWRAEYERLSEDDPAEGERYTQHLLSLLVGRRF